MKLLIESIYRTFIEVEVDSSRYPNDYLEVPTDKELTPEQRGRAALKLEVERDEESVYTEIFTERIESEGPDGFYHKVTLVDDNGKVIDCDEHTEADRDDVIPRS